MGGDRLHDAVRDAFDRRGAGGGEPDFVVVGEADNGRSAVSLAEKEAPNVIVMDIGMPELNGIEAAHQIVSRHPRTNVIVLSMHSDESYVMRALKAGSAARSM